MVDGSLSHTIIFFLKDKLEKRTLSINQDTTLQSTGSAQADQTKNKESRGHILTFKVQN